MKPRGMRSKWVKLRPWHFTKRRQPTRAAEQTTAITADHKSTTWDDLAAMYQRIAESEPPEPIKLTREQMAWLREQIPAQPYDSYRFSLNPLLGTPIHIVESYEKSTPHLKGWSGWPGDPR